MVSVKWKLADFLHRTMQILICLFNLPTPQEGILETWKIISHWRDLKFKSYQLQKIIPRIECQTVFLRHFSLFRVYLAKAHNCCTKNNDIDHIEEHITLNGGSRWATGNLLFKNLVELGKVFSICKIEGSGITCFI